MTALQTTAAPPRSVGAIVDFDGFDHLYREQRDAIFAYAMGLLRDRDAAEEVTAQCFERAYRKRRRMDTARGEARAWLFGIARNAALDELRRRKRQAVPTDADLLAEVVEDDRDEIGAADRRMVVRAALDRLPARDRELIALRFFAELSNAEIGEVLGISESNVGTRLSRVFSSLRGVL